MVRDMWVQWGFSLLRKTQTRNQWWELELGKFNLGNVAVSLEW